jgi:hypothetical protein
MIVLVSSAKVLNLVCLPFFGGKNPSKTNENRTKKEGTEKSSVQSNSRTL